MNASSTIDAMQVRNVVVRNIDAVLAERNLGQSEQDWQLLDAIASALDVPLSRLVEESAR